MIKANGILKIKNTELTSENKILRQRISFLENVVMNSHKICDK